jgi:arginine/ornithine N-succinyltransferase beta subunit
VSFRLRAATAADLEPLYEMAKLTGGGFTNLPADRNALARKLERAEAATRATRTRSPTSSSCWCSRSPKPARSAAPAS